MLRTELRFSADHWALRVLAVLLGEGFLGFLAIVAVALALFPMLFNVGAGAAQGIELAQWAIISWFGVEYVVALVSAKSRRLFLRDAWRWIDVLTILIPLASLLPSVSRLVRSTLILRLVRLARLLSLGVRATGIVMRDHQRRTVTAAATGPVRITQRAASGSTAPVTATREQLIDWVKSDAPGWYHVAGPEDSDLREIGAAARLPAGFLETHLLAATHPHVATTADCLAVFAWVPRSAASEFGIERSGLLILVSRHRVITLSRTPLPDAHEGMFPTIAAGGADSQRPEQVLAGLLDHIVRDNETLVAGFEQQLRALEDLPLRESRPAFFEQTFRLKKQLSGAQWDLWRMKAMLGHLAQHRTTPVPLSESAHATFAGLTASVDYLYDTVVNTREDLLAVIDLHLNVVSFDMNRVMRVLAVVSVLGLIPAVIGGLLGMNLIDNPWHFTLPQVTFVIGFGMLLGLYFFFVKGWLR